MRGIIIKIDPRFPAPIFWHLIDADSGDEISDVALLGLVVDAKNEEYSADLYHLDGTTETAHVVTAIVGAS